MFNEKLYINKNIINIYIYINKAFGTLIKLYVMVISDSFNVTNGVRQCGVLSPQLFNVYIDGLSDILNKSTIGGPIGGKLINHLLYADDLCIVSLSSAGLQQLLSICDQYCASHSLTFNVRKSVCMFF